MSKPPASKLIHLVTNTDIARSAQPPNLDDVADVRGWSSEHGFSYPAAPEPVYPDPLSEERKLAGDLLRRAQSGVTSSHIRGEFIPAYVPFEARTQLLVLTLAGGLAGLLLYSFFTRKPLIE